MRAASCSRSAIVRLLLAAAACHSSNGSSTPRPLESAVGQQASAPADPQPRAVAGLGPDAGTCAVSSEVACAVGCCPAGSSCFDGGCGENPKPGACPGTSPVVCAAPPDCSINCLAADESGLNNGAVLSGGATYAAGRFASGVTLDEPADAGATSCTSSIVAPGNGFPFGNDAETVEVWIYTSSTAAQTIFSQGSDGSRDLVLDSASSLHWGNAGPCPMQLGVWNFVASIYSTNGQSNQLYLNGSFCLEQYMAADSTAASSVLIGTHAPPNCAPFLGQIDELRVLNVAASPSQIFADYTAGPLTAIAGTVGLWHFDEGSATRCCPSGSSCAAGGDCQTGALASCPSGEPILCIDGTCCPTGTSCVPGGCEVASVAEVVCPSPTIACGAGTCCDEGYTCVNDACVLSPPAAPSPVCPDGSAISGNDPDECCPGGADYSGGRCVSGASCAVNQACALPFGCSVPGGGGICVAPGSPPLCSPQCEGGCCEDGGVCGSGGCCPEGTIHCGTACCSSSQCTAGTCTEAPDAGSCPSGSTNCAGACCGAGTTCQSGLCLSPQGPVPSTCASGTQCGSVCCPAGQPCLEDGLCGSVPAEGSCPASLPVACDPAGPCCPSGDSCDGGTCVVEGTLPPHGGPQGPSCGEGFCEPDEVCADFDTCCPTETPLACAADVCCPADVPCVDGDCGCPDGGVVCGDDCCGAGATCVDGECVSACDDPAFPTPCGDACCSAGAGCADEAESKCGCPSSDPVPCGTTCCLEGAACISSGNCGCPNGEAICGDDCCGDGQACVDGVCEDMSEGGGGDCDAFGEEYCLPTNGARCYNGTCQCCWSIESDNNYTCYGCVAACTARGYACADDGTCIFPPPPAGPACSN